MVEVRHMKKRHAAGCQLHGQRPSASLPVTILPVAIQDSPRAESIRAKPGYIRVPGSTKDSSRFCAP